MLNHGTVDLIGIGTNEQYINNHNIIVTTKLLKNVYRLVSKQPGVYKLMRQFQKIQNETENSIEQIIQGRTSKKRKTCNEEREQRIKNLVLRLKYLDISIIEFLRGISYNLSF